MEDEQQVKERLEKSPLVFFLNSLGENYATPTIETNRTESDRTNPK
jgi:hypothetical protein